MKVPREFESRTFRQFGSWSAWERDDVVTAQRGDNMTAMEELLTARDELMLLMATLDGHAAGQARSILARTERVIDLLRAPQRDRE